uniref:Uncharacterized protein n=1 Tax=Corvus moneduloides TaxID=1196302 RepID=A0A8U7NT85_CORMO
MYHISVVTFKRSIANHRRMFPIRSKSAVGHQLMHDKGRAFQGQKRLMWLHHALGAVHTASSRDIPLPNARWDVQRSQDPPNFNSIDRGEASSRMKQLLELTEAQGFLPLKQLDGKIPKAPGAHTQQEVWVINLHIHRLIHNLMF